MQVDHKHLNVDAQGLVATDQQKVFCKCLCTMRQGDPEHLSEVTAGQADCEIQNAKKMSEEQP